MAGEGGAKRHRGDRRVWTENGTRLFVMLSWWCLRLIASCLCPVLPPPVMVPKQSHSVMVLSLCGYTPAPAPMDAVVVAAAAGSQRQ